MIQYDDINQLPDNIKKQINKKLGNNKKQEEQNQNYDFGLFPPEEKSVKRQLQGKKNKYSGDFWEEIISNACKYYENQGIAKIEKEMEPMKPIKAIGLGRFIACYTKRAGVDYKGTLRGGKAIAFEAKHTETDVMQKSRLEPWQMEYLRQHTKLGATTFVLIAFEMKDFYRIPFTEWDNMKKVFGRVSLKREMIEKYRIQIEQGILQFLNQNDYQ